MADHIQQAETVLEVAAKPGLAQAPVLALQFAKAQAEATLAVAVELRMIREIMEGK